ncbi:MAG: hypothetical protein NT007_07130 [Candidatus Kapabacteria bacterium]|nr:hypothetical protein [Candidatus Kapabacteria bacterium]
MKEKFEPVEFSIGYLWTIISNNRKLFVSCLLISWIIFICFYILIPKSSTASTSLLPTKLNESNGGLAAFLQSAGGSGIGALVGGSKSEQKEMYVDILESRASSEFVFNKLNLRKSTYFTDYTDNEIIDIIHNNTKAEILKSGLISINFTFKTKVFPVKADKDSVAAFSSLVSNTLAEALDYYLRNRSLNMTRKSKKYIEIQLIDYRHELDSIESFLIDFQSKNKLISIEDQSKSLVSQAVEAGTALAKASVDLNLAKIEYEPGSAILNSLENNFKILKEQFDAVQKGGVYSNEFSLPFKDIPTITRKYLDIYRERKILEQVLIYLETQKHQEAIQEAKDLPVIEILDKSLGYNNISSPRFIPFIILGTMIVILLLIFFIVSYSFYKGHLIIKSANDVTKANL